MPPTWLQSLKRCVNFLSRSRARSASKQRRQTRRPTVEPLEDRVTPSTVTWLGNAGTLNWGDAGNWSNNLVPTNADDVTISKTGVGTITIGGANFGAHSLNDTTALLLITPAASLSIVGAASSILGQNVTVQSGGTLTLGTG